VDLTIETVENDEVLTFINIMACMIVSAQEKATFAFAHFASMKIQTNIAAVSIILHTLVHVNA
jgi:hypothetical protein